MDKKFEAFYDLQGQRTTYMGVPYNELFSTEEIRRLTFTRFYAGRNQELFPVPAENTAPARPHPLDNFLMTPTTLMNNWLLLGFRVFSSPPVAMAAIMTEYSQLPLRVAGVGDISQW